VPVIGEFLYPDNIAPDVDLDYEMGGIGLNNPFLGLMVQAWTMQLFVDPDTSIGSIYLSAPTVAPTLVFQDVGIQNCAFAFDQNMNPVICFTQAGFARFRWFDATISDYTITTLPAGSTPPRATLDDKRASQIPVSDVLVCYTRAGNLYMRAQRDRYLIEYLLKTGVTGRVLQFGMGDKLRVQILVGASL
jgi:hypothetical protein